MRLIISFSLLLATLTISAQELQFGFGVDVSHSQFQLPDLTGREFETLNVDDFKAQSMGFGFSLFNRLAINDNFALSFIFSLQLNGARVINYVHLFAPPRIYKIAIALPLALEWTTGQGKWQPFAAVGLGPLINLSDRAYPSGFKIPNEFLFGQISAGFNCNTNTKFDVRPEFVYSHSLSDLVRGEFSDVYTVNWQYTGLRVLFTAN